MLHIVLFYTKMTILINFNFDNKRRTLIFSEICDKKMHRVTGLFYILYVLLQMKYFICYLINNEIQVINTRWNYIHVISDKPF